MGPRSHLFLAIFAASAMLQFKVSNGFEWEASSPPDGATIQACTGDTVSFPWKFSVTNEETVINVEWHRLTEGGDTMVAILVAGFFVKLPATTFNTVFLPNAGLEISGFTWEDYGTYRVTVNYRVTNTLFSESLSVNLTLPVAPVLKGDRLKAHVQPEPVVDATTGKRHVQLKCGTFVELVTGAEVYVEWKTPTGETMSSTSFSDGNFHLTLPDPVFGGTYTCYLKDREVMARCMKNVHALEDSVLVDEVQAQLILLKGGIHRLSLKDQLIDDELKTQEKTDLELSANISRLHDKFITQELANVNLNSESQGSRWVSRDDFEQLESKLETLVGLSFCKPYKFHYRLSCYHIVNETLTWNAAKEKCKTLGGKLAEIESSGENDYIRKIPAELKTGDLWLGGTDQGAEGNWVWASSNKVIEFTSWNKGQPDNYRKNEHCLQLRKEYDYKWNDNPCQIAYMFVCEISVSADV